MNGSFVTEMPEGAECEQNGMDIMCDFYLQDEWTDPENHEVSSIYKYHRQRMQFRIHWVDGPESRTVAGEDKWDLACNHDTRTWSVSHHGDGDRLRHIVCEDADPQIVKLATENSLERFN